MYSKRRASLVKSYPRRWPTLAGTSNIARGLREEDQLENLPTNDRWRKRPDSDMEWPAEKGVGPLQPPGLNM